MIFGLFGSKRKKNVSDLLSEFVIYQQLINRLGKVQSLRKLNRVDEAQQVFLETERIAINYLKKNPHEKKAHMMLALFYIEASNFDQAEPIIERLLNSGEFKLSDDERNIFSSQLQEGRRQRPSSQREADSPKGFTQVFCCANCGRLHNFVSMPCPHCDWFPKTIEETARSIILSNSHFKIQTLLILAREMANGRTADDVVPNLISDGKTYLNESKQRQVVEQIFSLLRQNEHKNHRSLRMIRECDNCGKSIFFSGSEECEKCGESVHWPDVIRTLICIDNLLWLLENRSETSSGEAFSDFVCLLVFMANNILRKQETSSERDRRYGLQLLRDMGVVCDLNKGAIIETKDPNNLKIYLIKDSMRKDSETFGMLWFKELEFFIDKLINGVRP